MSENVEKGSTSKSSDLDDEKEEHRPKGGHLIAEAANLSVYSKFKQFWANSAVTYPILQMMFKGALPATIALAIYCSPAVANLYGNSGYLMAIMANLSFCILPRARFVQNAILNSMAACVAACSALLMCYCGIKAREHTTPPLGEGKANLDHYNAAASATMGLWLFFQIYMVNTLRAFYPQLQMPSIFYNIFINSSCIYGTQFLGMEEAISFVCRLLISNLSGIAVASAVSLIIIPRNSRRGVFQAFATYNKALTAALKAQANYIAALEGDEIHQLGEKKGIGKPAGQLPAKILDPSKGAEMKAALQKLGGMQSKLEGDIKYAKREVAWGKLDAQDIDETFRLLRNITIPVVGISSIASIIERTARPKAQDANQNRAQQSVKYIKKVQVPKKHFVMDPMPDLIATMIEIIAEGLDHVSSTMGFIKDKTIPPVDKVDDPEREAEESRPGTRGFSKELEKKLDFFVEQQRKSLKEWYGEYDENKPLNTSSEVSKSHFGISSGSKRRKELIMALYAEHLLTNTGQATLEIVRFVDRKFETGELKSNRLITPGFRRAREWIASVFHKEISDTNVIHAPESQEPMTANFDAPDVFKGQKDPEHLPPANSWERLSDKVRSISHFLASPASCFGFRAACATFSVGVLAFLRETQIFFIAQRLVWAMVMVSIGMTLTAGMAIHNFILRIAGTIIAMVASLVIWYIVDGHPAGVIVFMGVWLGICQYFLIRFPQYLIAGMISMMTAIVIIGYELQVQQIGPELAERNGQPVYPIWELAPYRLACVVAGLGVAFVWTIFPYPITARSSLRRDLGAAVYLLAKFQSSVYSLVQVRLDGMEGDAASKSSPGRRLQKACTKIFSEEIGLFTRIDEHLKSTVFEAGFGGKFPQKKYDKIANHARDIFRFLNLTAYSSRAFSQLPSPSSFFSTSSPSLPPRSIPHLDDFAHSLRTFSHEAITALVLLSSAISDGKPLPPYLRCPTVARLELFEDPRKVLLGHEDENRDRNNDRFKDNNQHEQQDYYHQAYAAVAVIQIASKMIEEDLKELVECVRDLVGELKFELGWEGVVVAGQEIGAVAA